MKKLIKLSETHYIVTDDSEIKEGDWHLSWDVENNISTNHTISNTFSHWFVNAENYKKIIHSTQPIEPSLKSDKVNNPNEFVLIKQLPLSNAQEIDYGYNIEKIGEDATNIRILKHKTPSQVARQYFDGYIEGFNTHKELTKDKLFTVEDMRKAFEFYAFKSTSQQPYNEKELEEHFNKFMNQLLPPTEWNVEFDKQGKIKLI